MGVFADVLAQRKTFEVESQEGNYLRGRIATKADPSISAAAAIDAIHTLAVDTVDHTGGTFTLTIGIRSATGQTYTTFTTAGIAYNANAATIEGAIDTAATAASVPSWTNGDITVAGGNLQSATPVTLTFDGASVAGRQHAATIFNDSMTGGTSPGTRVTVSTAGQTARPAWGVLLATGVITGTLPNQTANASASAVTKGSNFQKIPDWFIRSMAREAAAEDGNNESYFSIVGSLDYQDRAPKAQYTDTSSDIL